MYITGSVITFLAGHSKALLILNIPGVQRQVLTQLLG